MGELSEAAAAFADIGRAAKVAADTLRNSLIDIRAYHWYSANYSEAHLWLLLERAGLDGNCEGERMRVIRAFSKEFKARKQAKLKKRLRIKKRGW